MDPNDIYLLSKKIGRSSHEKILFNYPFLCVIYARDVIKGRWIEAEPHILLSKDSYSITKYAIDVIKGEWKEAEKVLLSIKNHDQLILYASKAKKARMPKLEVLLMTTNDTKSKDKYNSLFQTSIS